MARFYKVTAPDDIDGQRGMGIVYAKSEFRAQRAMADSQFKVTKADDRDLLRFSQVGGRILDDTGTLTPEDLKVAQNKAAIGEPTLGSNEPLPNHELPLAPTPAPAPDAQDFNGDTVDEVESMF